VLAFLVVHGCFGVYFVFLFAVAQFVLVWFGLVWFGLVWFA